MGGKVGQKERRHTGSAEAVSVFPRNNRYKPKRVHIGKKKKGGAILSETRNEDCQGAAKAKERFEERPSEGSERGLAVAGKGSTYSEPVSKEKR